MLLQLQLFRRYMWLTTFCILRIKNLEPTDADSRFVVGVSGFEPEASWTRTKRDTKLRHTPLAMPL